MELLFVIESSSSSSLLCSTVNNRSLARALFDINSMLTTIGLGRRIPAQVNSPSTSQSRHSSVAHYSTNKTVTKNISSGTSKHGKQTSLLSLIDNSKPKSQFVILILDRNSSIHICDRVHLFFHFHFHHYLQNILVKKIKILITSVEKRAIK